MPKQVDQKIKEQLKKLEEKYEVMGQDLSSYLDGLLYADYLTYWDYVHLDTLLSLQNPKTGFKDETIFIIYHQHTELFFKLILHEYAQLRDEENLTIDFFKTRIRRVIRYFGILDHSFSVMIDGMEKEQFLKFRMSLLPSSGFQSAQYRLIELASTDLKNLAEPDKRNGKYSMEEWFEHIYWRRGATELSSGKKTLTLKQFEEKYMTDFMRRANEWKDKNIWQLYKQNFEDQKDVELIELMKSLDVEANVSWPLSHYKSAARYLHKDPDSIAATGGTNWQAYLPPRFQRVSYFPELWTQEELDEWGKSWVFKEVLNR